MALSNTATPYYYGLFRDAVIRGDRPVCKEIAQQMARIDEKIANPAFYYDPLVVEGFIQFCEQECTLVDGGPVHMLDEFKLWGEELANITQIDGLKICLDGIILLNVVSLFQMKMDQEGTMKLKR